MIWWWRSFAAVLDSIGGQIFEHCVITQQERRLRQRFIGRVGVRGSSVYHSIIE